MRDELQIKRKGITLKIAVDYSYDGNPRLNDENIGKMICFCKRYKLGDEHDFDKPATFYKFLETNNNKICCVLPLYLYDHSGLSISTTDFGDKWDSYQVGYIYCTKENVKQFGLFPDDTKVVAEKLKLEVERYNQYLNNEIKHYYFCLRDENDEIIDTISGFEGNKLEDMCKEMKEYVSEEYYFLFDELVKKQENYM